MPAFSRSLPPWLVSWMQTQNIGVWGVADLRGFPTPIYSKGKSFPCALSWVIPMAPHVMAAIRRGPNQDYADEYAKVNVRINKLAEMLVAEIQDRGYRSQALAASDRSDPVNIRGDFPHKTAATRAGIGWIGRHCQLITRRFGSWVRLGTVFTDLMLPCGPPIERSFCGHCMLCVDACPAKALTGNAWSAGLRREEILDVEACDRWKKKHYPQYHNGHNCGICSAVCPYGLKALKRKAEVNLG